MVGPGPLDCVAQTLKPGLERRAADGERPPCASTPITLGSICCADLVMIGGDRCARAWWPIRWITDRPAAASTRWARPTASSPHPLYLALGTAAEDRQRTYRAPFMAALGEASIAELRMALNQDQPIGNVRFHAEIEVAIGFIPDQARRSGLKRQSRSPSGADTGAVTIRQLQPAWPGSAT